MEKFVKVSLTILADRTLTAADKLVLAIQRDPYLTKEGENDSVRGIAKVSGLGIGTISDCLRWLALPKSKRSETERVRYLNSVRKPNAARTVSEQKRTVSEQKRSETEPPTPPIRNRLQTSDKTDVAAASRRDRNPLWDIIASLWFGGDVRPPHSARVGKVVRDLKELGATPDEIRVRHARMTRAWAGRAEATPEALVKHWYTFATEPTHNGDYKPAKYANLPNGVHDDAEPIHS